MNKVNSLVWRNMINEGIWMGGIGISRAGALEKYDQRREEQTENDMHTFS